MDRVIAHSDVWGHERTYYRRNERGLVLSRALSKVGGERKPDLDGLQEFFRFGVNMSGSSIVKDVGQLPLGEALYESGFRDVVDGWFMNRTSTGDLPVGECLAELMRNCERLRGRRPVLLIGGGVDAYLIYLILNHLKIEFTCATLGFKEGDELRASEVTRAKSLRDDVVLIEAGPEDFVRMARKIMKDGDSFGPCGKWHHYFLSSEVARLGLGDVIVTGRGADCVFGGFDWFRGKPFEESSVPGLKDSVRLFGNSHPLDWEDIVSDWKERREGIRCESLDEWFLYDMAIARQGLSPASATRHYCLVEEMSPFWSDDLRTMVRMRGVRTLGSVSKPIVRRMVERMVGDPEWMCREKIGFGSPVEKWIQEKRLDGLISELGDQTVFDVDELRRLIFEPGFGSRGHRLLIWAVDTMGSFR